MLLINHRKPGQVQNAFRCFSTEQQEWQETPHRYQREIAANTSGQ